jgi:GxxExxY protein
MIDLLYSKVTEKILQAAFEVHKYFGCGFLEKVYENAFKYKLELLDLNVEQQFPIPVFFIDKVKVGEYVADLVVDDKIIIELKAISNLDKIHYAQVKNYLKVTNIKLGLLVNFRFPILQFKRIIL